MASLAVLQRLARLWRGPDLRGFRVVSSTLYAKVQKESSDNGVELLSRISSNAFAVLSQ